jgi:hypothetical protein
MEEECKSCEEDKAKVIQLLERLLFLARNDKVGSFACVALSDMKDTPHTRVVSVRREDITELIGMVTILQKMLLDDVVIATPEGDEPA